MQNRCSDCGHFMQANTGFTRCLSCRQRSAVSVLGCDEWGQKTPLEIEEVDLELEDLSEIYNGDEPNAAVEARQRLAARRQQLLDDPETYFAEARKNALAIVQSASEGAKRHPVKRWWRRRPTSVRWH